MNLYDVSHASFSDDPNTSLMYLPDGRTVTYGGMDGLSASIATRLADNGARPGDRLMMQVEKMPEAITLYLACLRAGVIFVPLNPAYGRDIGRTRKEPSPSSAPMADSSPEISDRSMPTPCRAMPWARSKRPSGALPMTVFFAT